MAPTVEERERQAVLLRYWLPRCQRRVLPRGSGRRQARGIRYFTFCGDDPDDVVLLQVMRLLPGEADGGFESVTLFDRRGVDPTRAISAVRGAYNLGASFVDTVLASEALPFGVELGSSEAKAHESALIRREQLRTRFPFDVINFDWEEVLFQNGEEPPGRYVAALKKVFEWQSELSGDAEARFSLMVTVRAPERAQMSAEADEWLMRVVDENLAASQSLREVFRTRRGVESAAALGASDWNALFGVAMPKLLLGVLRSTGWCVDLNHGIELVTRTKEQPGGACELMHIIADVRRCTGEEDAVSAYDAAAEKVFGSEAIRMADGAVDGEVINSLARVKETVRANRGDSSPW